MSGQIPTRERLATSDGRHTRWHAHRVEARADLVTLTLQAIDEHGPSLSLDDVVKATGVVKPKIYRIFANKAALFNAVAERVQALTLRHVTSAMTTTGTFEDLVRSTLTAYVNLAAESPNRIRFLAQSPAILTEKGASLHVAITQQLSASARTLGSNDSHIEYFADALIGTAVFGILRWLSQATITKDKLIEEMTIWICGAAVAAARESILAPARLMPSTPRDGIVTPDLVRDVAEIEELRHRRPRRPHDLPPFNQRRDAATEPVSHLYRSSDHQNDYSIQ
ncbi:TetR/AcrR family transcriptional regulator [Mycobacteroides abscessus subsp. bolletii]|uniref:TetR/AcrR family transcriptional regulator n=1 Tax=Mycobacteroides abscessus TaxID=36809 RepID=UPI0019D01060|nr:TetR/AcrR family transcriptional regulator [Mycobacteroides abscessus]MBN7303150.1 TetR/AcrR family transcriptional regulator [Mycobacteroides abscessus subsp. bolletii]